MIKVPWRDLAFTVISGLVVQRIVEGRGFSDILGFFRRGSAPAPAAKSPLPDPVVPERFGHHPYAIYHERIVWMLSNDLDLEKTRKARNFLNQHDGIIRENYNRKVTPGEVARAVQEIMDGKAPMPPSLDTKVAFMARAEEVLAPRPKQEVILTLPENTSVRREIRPAPMPQEDMGEEDY